MFTISRSSLTLGLVLVAAASGRVLAASAAAADAEPARAEPEHKASDYVLPVVPCLCGERIRFEFGWAGRRAAKGAINVAEEVKDGAAGFAIKGTCRTTSLVDRLWKMRGSIYCRVDGDSLLARAYRIESRGRKRHRIKEIEYDPKNGRAKLTHRKLEKKKRATRELDCPVPLDPVAMAYYVRGLDLKEHARVSVEFLTGKHRYRIDLKREGREKIKVKAGTYDAIKLGAKIVKLTGRHAGTKVKNAHIWLSADERRIPLKFTSAVFVGHVYGELTAYTSAEQR